MIEEVMVGRKWWRDGGGDREAVVMKMGMVLVIGKSAYIPSTLHSCTALYSLHQPSHIPHPHSYLPVSIFILLL